MLPLLGEMMSIIKSIALDERTAQIAQDLPNFSHFVRECLYRHAINMNLEECTREKPWRGLPRCNPSTQPVCFVCWPNGNPPVEAISRSVLKKSRHNELDPRLLSYLDEEARKKNRYLVDIKGIDKKVRKNLIDKPGVKGSKRPKIVNRILRSLRVR